VVAACTSLLTICENEYVVEAHTLAALLGDIRSVGSLQNGILYRTPHIAVLLYHQTAACRFLLMIASVDDTHYTLLIHYTQYYMFMLNHVRIRLYTVYTRRTHPLKVEH
jgi:hypothetical protein